MKVRSPIAANQDSTPASNREPLPTISIVIKALNEEAKIGRCLESVMAALAELPNPSEIVLADSVSTDRTVEIAQRYPVTIVQFRYAKERGCGAAVQLGYQHSRGDFIMLLDGDMEILPGFLPFAMQKLAVDPGLAGVAGLVEDTSIRNAFDRRRVATGAISKPAQAPGWLSGGGLYRRRAILEAGGYAADRNLRAWEEAELGMRLAAAGWSLERVDARSTRHTGHTASTVELLRSGWKSRRAMANGVLIKQAVGKPWMFQAFMLLLHPMLVILMWCGALIVVGLGVATGGWHWAASYGLIVLCLVVLFAVHKRSLTQALVSFALWHYMAAALLFGLGQPVTNPRSRIESVELASCSPAESRSPQTAKC